MKNKKVMITMIVVISLLLTSIVTIAGLKLANIDIVKIAKNQNTEQQNEEVANEVANVAEDESINNTEENTQENEETKTPSGVANETGLISTISSRSDVNRLARYVNLNTEQPTEEYVEVKEYIKIEDVKISFDMDVSKTTGLSKEDFITFVQNMKCDRTGILAKNAGWIWECCQKYSVNEIFVLGVCGIESAWCSAPQHQNTHNYSSLMSGGRLIPYATDEAGFEAMIKLLGERYLTPGASFYHGATITGVGTCYCNPTSWPGKVYTCMQQAMR